MRNSYFKIPLEFDSFFPQESSEKGGSTRSKTQITKTYSLKNSLDNFIELLLTTHYGDYKHDYKFGFEIWENEFENIQIQKFNTHNYPRKDLEKSFKRTIELYEPRLKDVRVEIMFVYKKEFKGKKVKYFVEITVKGTLDNKTKDEYMKNFQFAMGPFYKR